MYEDQYFSTSFLHVQWLMLYKPVSGILVSNDFLGIHGLK